MKLVGLTRDAAISIAIAFSTFIALLALTLGGNESFMQWTAALVIAIALPAAVLLIKKRSIHSYNNRTVAVIVLTAALLYLTLYYFAGLSFGYSASSKGELSPSSFVKYVIPITLSVVGYEFIREILLAQKSRLVIFLSYAVGVAGEAVVAGGLSAVTSSYKFADFIGMSLFPALTANILYTYLSKEFGKLPCISYRLLMTLYVFLIPAKPALPGSLPAFALLILPLGLYAFIKFLFEKKVRAAGKKKDYPGMIFTAIAVVLMLCFVLLITCQFRFGMLVIASESMTGEINRGDAVVFESYDDCREIRENDVIVFTEGNKRVVHRVVAIVNENGQRRYVTKGDANEDIDLGFRTDEDIVGLVHFKVLYIGYPSLWLREIFNKS